MVRHYGGLGVESGGYLSPSVSLSLSVQQCELAQEFCVHESRKNWSNFYSLVPSVCVYVCAFQRGETALHMAARAGQSNVVRYLIQNGARVDAKAKVVHMCLLSSDKTVP